MANKFSHTSAEGPLLNCLLVQVYFFISLFFKTYHFLQKIGEFHEAHARDHSPGPQLKLPLYEQLLFIRQPSLRERLASTVFYIPPSVISLFL